MSTATGALRLPAGAEARRIRRLAGLPAVGGGELRVAVRDQLGRRRAGPPLHYVDTAQGRYLTLSEITGGERYVLIIPGCQDNLAARLRDQGHRLNAPSRRTRDG